MKKLMIAVVAAASLAAANSAPGQQPATEIVTPVIVSPMPAAVSAPRYAPSRRQVRTYQRPGVLSNLIELERRKNAWLRSTFLGR